MKKKLTVVALGGNALLRGNEAGTIEEQEENTYNTCVKLIETFKEEHNLIITHGNGPQVGNILLRNDAGYKEYKIPKMPLDICVADSQGGIGYMIERMMRNALNDFNIKRDVVTVITQVLVNLNDPAFKDPSKPIGAFFLKEEADLLSKSNDWIFKEDSRKRGWRRVVPSPKPIDILNKEAIKTLAENGTIVIAVGGGGIPVFKHENNFLEAIEAVVDKDLASALLARDIKAVEFYVLTDVSHVYLNFNKKDQKALEQITVQDAIAYYQQGEFADGSMGPKILAAIDFVNNGGKQTVITEANELHKKKCGTRIIMDRN
ncbi:carbamate kinase [Bacteroidota bacterium]